MPAVTPPPPASIPLPESTPNLLRASSSNSAGVPGYILEHAPLVYLHSHEPHWPSEALTHIANCTPQPSPPDATLPAGFAILAHPSVNHDKCYLTSKHNACKTLNAEWIVSTVGKPDKEGRSASKAVLITVEKDYIAPGTVDAFWFFFYSFNLGPKVIGLNFGNHVASSTPSRGTNPPSSLSLSQADWEHCMMRFTNGVPQFVHLSAHADGFSYTYDCLEKKGKHPVIYSAKGSHALYPTSGKHDYSPVKVVGPIDYTNAGHLWDPSLHFRSYKYVHSDARDGFVPYTKVDEDFLPCVRYRGQWGDRYSLMIEADEKWWMKLEPERIRRALTLHALRWGDGISGPRDKDLNRTNMNRRDNIIKTSIVGA